MSSATIHEACCSGDIDAVRAFIAADPAIVDADDQYKWRPIFHAGLYRQEQIVRLLIEAGADLGAHDGYVMHYAGEVPNNKAIIRLLVQYGGLDAHVLPTSDLSRQFLAAVFLADRTRVHSLLARHPELATTPDGRGDLPIHHAARNGDTEIVRKLIDAGSEVTARTTRNQTVIYCAGGHGHLETLKLLVSSPTSQPKELSQQINDLIEWLGQYPDDCRYKPVAAFLKQHTANS